MKDSNSLLSEFGKDAIARVTHCASELQKGHPILLMDDENRENEADLIYAAEKITPEKVNFLKKTCSGIICLCLTEERAKNLKLELMVPESENSCKQGTAFTVSIDARVGIQSGVSASDRSCTILAAISDSASPQDLVRPGHVFPLRAKTKGTLERRGHTEGSIDLVRAAGLKPAAVLCELMNDDGTVARQADILAFARKYQLGVTTVNDIVVYRKSRGD